LRFDVSCDSKSGKFPKRSVLIIFFFEHLAKQLEWFFTLVVY